MICHICGSDKGIDPFNNGSVMCLECFYRLFAELYKDVP